ncbi:hypothetical protein SAMN05216382_2340 [Sphingomonas palmae]|uniref:Uncharacterized protein n=1 Tax=Sphingomonas palmae TaxID=1855283 RepID=A0A1H7RSF5_9SPHN|nr:hypothetical protein [Sphingomonas palmae]SEL63115.1 hypothetical protein SAMN05216382_2340 [Sphingomonas palmae]
MNEPIRGSRPVHHDFLLQERDASSVLPGAARAPFTAARDALRQAWAPPLDTFVTEDLPMLLTRLNLVQAVRTARAEDEFAGDVR